MTEIAVTIELFPPSINSTAPSYYWIISNEQSQSVAGYL